MYTVYFTRKHVKGLLAGITTEGKLPFVNMSNAIDWIERTKDRLIDNEYKIENCSIEMPTY